MTTTQAITNAASDMLSIKLDDGRPCASALELAQKLAEYINEQCGSVDADTAASALVAALRATVLENDEPRPFDLWEEGYHYTTVVATTAEEALELARGNVERANYADAVGTLYVDVRATCKLTDEDASDTVALEPEEPECVEGEEHDWQSPHEILGGCESNPGVSGHGGGVIIREVCMRCGCGRTTDTWAQRRDTGEQGLTEISYEPGRYTDTIPTREERELEEH